MALIYDIPSFIFGCFVTMENTDSGSLPYFRFGLLMGLIGSLTGPSLCFIFPCYCHLKLRWNSISVWHKVTDILLIAFGMGSGAVGIYYSVKALIFSWVCGTSYLGHPDFFHGSINIVPDQELENRDNSKFFWYNFLIKFLSGSKYEILKNPQDVNFLMDPEVLWTAD